ncbi:hypothetical protein GKZ89_06465 [Bacillus mangrovi]|uniref:Histidine phosphatase family protein n=1 Tax=Metabacillus mangrovi TaxID=1491830 RepID=A0A7X2S4E3_9BACI|nr:histidine phosphatase family protein [Metabacillus mangrovi]MTH53050.1 hypothetical protein [Metabacillus mangrovi]
MDDIVAVALLRHGLTEKNSRRAYIGWTDDPLSEEGRKALSGIEHFSPELVITSGMKRTDQTADLLFPGAARHSISSFKEIHFGEWEGRTFDELKAEPAYREWVDNMDQHAPPGGESLSVFKERVMAGWAEARKEIGARKTSAVIAHGGTIRHLMTQLTEDRRGFWDWPCLPGEGYILYWTKEAFRRGERCISYQAEPAMENRRG